MQSRDRQLCSKGALTPSLAPGIVECSAFGVCNTAQLWFVANVAAESWNEPEAQIPQRRTSQ